MNIQFGSGVLYGKPSAGNQPTNPSAFKFNVLQECDVTFKGDLKKLYGQNQFAVATARGKLDCTIKGKLAVYDIAMLNQLYFAQTQTQGYNLQVDSESQTVTTAAATVSNVPIVEDWGVTYKSTGQALVHVAGAPGVGQYSGPNLSTGVYTFNAGDNTNVVAISYNYFVNSGATISIINQLMGYAPELSMLLFNKFRSKYLAIELNDVTLGTISAPTKLEDFWISDFDGSANADASGNIGKIMADLF